MQKIASALRRLILVLALLGIAYVAVMNYHYLFARTVTGEILDVAGGIEPAAYVAGTVARPTTQVYSFAVSIREPSGEIMISSSEDRKWAVAKKGFCVVATFYPYPPWNVEKAGTYHNARLDRMMDCPKAAQAPAAAPAAATTAGAQ